MLFLIKISFNFAAEKPGHQKVPFFQWWSYAWANWAVARPPHLILLTVAPPPHLSLRATWPPQILLCTQRYQAILSGPLIFASLIAGVRGS